MMAAAALAGLEYTMPLLPRVHALTQQTATSLREAGYTIALPVQTNMIVLDLEKDDIPPAAFVEYGKRAGLAFFPTGRLAFHHQTSPEAAAKVVTALTTLMEDKKAGKALENHKVTGGYM
jgi:threonine aldolase